MTFNRKLGWFVVAGLVGLVVDIAVLTALREPLGIYSARVASFVFAATATWLLNRILTFAGRSSGVSVWNEYLRYMGLMLGGGLVNFTTYSVLVWKFEQTPLWLSLYVCVGSLAGMVVNYLSASYWLYRHKA
ncbi:GtrA family protein [Acidovorax radicis]|uniref:GtrA family protein n=1 Tax=Acidovorax radicis TaxID=758826 RepID=UPI001CF838EF|nr:GtrA family protein [Acidovorax radicis]UCU98663.1 GtrA family protein [Acidovorax radicis]